VLNIKVKILLKALLVFMNEHVKTIYHALLVFAQSIFVYTQYVYNVCLTYTRKSRLIFVKCLLIEDK